MSKGETATLIERHRRFWLREPVERPLLHFTVVTEDTTEEEPMVLPLADGSLANEGMRLLPHMLSPELLQPRPAEPSLSEPPIAGDFFIGAAPYGTVPWMEAIVGCTIRVGLKSRSMWSEPVLPADWHERPLALRIDKQWRDKLLEFMHHLVRTVGNRYCLAHTLMRGPSDMAEALLGPEALCTAMIDHPEALRTLLDFCTDAFIETAQGQTTLIPAFHGGHCVFGIWAPGTCVRTQDDASVLFSAEHCRQFILPQQERIAACFDYTVVHLHSASLHTAEVYSSARNISAIQVSLDPPIGEVRTRSLLPTLAGIMERKPLIITGGLTQKELVLLLSGLPKSGLGITCTVAEPRRG